ncbi:carbon-nitrogen hydrolase family protein [Aquibacillus albus]|uniref:Amidohydrolase n=1 Tax=Aquibacillus albus TaxID=1168171 RepID=A0ABS2N3I4_9BACI|nr:carbon-nitrogen hydrolase family protein [Aquibacillus albus]MBM7572698.1 putative amidohydrolase [Aquibacillus albus]
MTNLVKIATVSMNVAFNKKQNLDKYLDYIKKASLEGTKLIVFPEQSLQGYLKSLHSMDLDNVNYQHKNAEVIPDGLSVQTLIRAAKEYDIYIVFGMTEKDRERQDILYNSAVLVGPEGYIGTYRKVHQPGDETHVFTPGEEFKVFSTEIGNIGLLICFDKAYPESSRELALKGADILISPTAWTMPAAGTDQWKGYYDVLDQVRAFENQLWFISSDMCGPHGDHNYYGHSRIVDPTGATVAECGYEEGVAYAEINIREGLLQARTSLGILLNLIKNRKPSAYHSIPSNV